MRTLLLKSSTLKIFYIFFNISIAFNANNALSSGSDLIEFDINERSNFGAKVNIKRNQSIGGKGIDIRLYLKDSQGRIIRSLRKESSAPYEWGSKNEGEGCTKDKRSMNNIKAGDYIIRAEIQEGSYKTDYIEERITLPNITINCSTQSNRKVGNNNGADSNLKVNINNDWYGICCNGDKISLNGTCRWKEAGRELKITSGTGKGRSLNCPENNNNDADCSCRGSERFHGVKGTNGNVPVSNSLRLKNGGPIFPDSSHSTCLKHNNKDVLRAKRVDNLTNQWTTSTITWVDNKCLRFKLK